MNKMKLMKKFLLIILILILLIVNMNILNISFAIGDLKSQLKSAANRGGNFSNATAEALYKVGLAVDIPPGPPSVGVTPPPNIVKKERILNLTAQRIIEGNAFEDIPRLVENANAYTSSLKTTQINTNAIKDNDESAISNIVVELLNSNNELVKTTKTDNNRTLYIWFQQWYRFKRWTSWNV